MFYSTLGRLGLLPCTPQPPSSLDVPRTWEPLLCNTLDTCSNKMLLVEHRYTTARILLAIFFFFLSFSNVIWFLTEIQGSSLKRKTFSYTFFFLFEYYQIHKSSDLLLPHHKQLLHQQPCLLYLYSTPLSSLASASYS